MNKLRRRYNQVSFPSVDKVTNHKKGSLPGNMMGYPDSSQPATSHNKGSMPGNMMAYASSRNADAYPKRSDDSQNYGPKPLKDPTRSGFNGKTIPAQLKQYVGYDADNKEWTQIATVPKKKGAFYG